MEGPSSLQRYSPHACEETLEAEGRTGKKEQIEESSELTQLVHAPTSQSTKEKTLKYVRY